MAPVKCDLILERINWEKKVLRRPAVSCRASHLSAAVSASDSPFIALRLAGQVRHKNGSSLDHPMPFVARALACSGELQFAVVPGGMSAGLPAKDRQRVSHLHVAHPTVTVEPR